MTLLELINITNGEKVFNYYENIFQREYGHNCLITKEDFLLELDNFKKAEPYIGEAFSQKILFTEWMGLFYIVATTSAYTMEGLNAQQLGSLSVIFDLTKLEKPNDDRVLAKIMFELKVNGFGKLK